MEQIDQLQQAPMQASASPGSMQADALPRLRSRFFPRVIGRYRVFVAGVLAIVLALAGEILMRSPAPGLPSNPAVSIGPLFTLLGGLLVGLAALLVGVVAWVNDGFRTGRNEIPVPAPIGQSEIATPVPTRAVRVRSTQRVQSEPSLVRNPARQLRIATLRYSIARTRLGWYGTAAGALLALALGVWLALILRADWRDPLAGWVWLAIMLVLLATFAGVRPWPAAATLIAHDPAEPAFEPPVVRVEWVIVAIIMAAAVVLRLWHLDSIPAGPYIDESGRALDARNLNYGLPVNREPFVFVGTGWWGVPSFYFWLVAQSMKVFGDNLLGARVVHALAGIGTVWYTYRIGRVVWSPRAGLIAGALIAISDFAIQASRTAGESTITLFCWTACFYYLYKALKLRQPLDFVLAGLAGGFVLLGYASGKLLPPFLALAAVYLLLRWGFTGIKRYLPGLALVAVAAAVVCVPNLVFQFTQKPSAMTERYNSVTIFTPEQQSRLAAQYGTNNEGLILAHQYVTTYSVYDVGQEKGPFYPTGQPVLPIPWAALWVLGTAYLLWRLGDARYAILGIWVLAALSGSALTIDTPTLQRALMIIPTLALVPAIFLDRIASSAPVIRFPALKFGSLSNKGIKIRKSNMTGWVTWALIGAFVLFSAFQVLTYYFGPYTDKALYIEFTLAGRYMEKLNPQKDVVYDYGLPIMFGDPSPLIFLGNGITRHDFSNSSDVLPVTDNEGSDVHFMVSPPDDPIIGLLQDFYPGGTSSVLRKPDGTPVVAVYHVTAAEIDQQRIMTARYRMPDGILLERQEPRLGTSPVPGASDISPPDGIAYPTTAQWLGGLVSPSDGTYNMELDAPAGGTLSIDSRQVLAATAGVRATVSRVVLSKGMHRLKLQGTMDSATTNIGLLWGKDNSAMLPVSRDFLWGGPQGALTGQVYTQPGTLGWLLLDQLPTPNSSPSQVRNDNSFSWANLNQSLRAGPNPLVVWRGVLVAPVQGSYQFEAITPGAVTIWIDSKLVGISNVPNTPNQWPVNTKLAAGQHQFEMRYYSLRDNAQFHLYWQVPGQARSLVPPSAFLPAQSGAWPASGTLPVGTQDISVIH